MLSLEVLSLKAFSPSCQRDRELLVLGEQEREEGREEQPGDPGHRPRSEAVESLRLRGAFLYLILIDFFCLVPDILTDWLETALEASFILWRAESSLQM